LFLNKIAKRKLASLRSLEKIKISRHEIFYLSMKIKQIKITTSSFYIISKIDL
jgi:hypothetical protein